MEEEGVVFKTGVDVGKDVKAQELLKEFDRVVLPAEPPIQEISRCREEMRETSILP